jgi:2-C-methyl-D-erythritol 4-phosphate cytidylyltransferase/2-C-methyl-D-erythritol 2,4-cyclodiphosphate synthase
LPSKSHKNVTIILAAGDSSRFDFECSKMMAKVSGKPLLYFTLIAFQDHSEIDEIVLVVNKEIYQHSVDIVSTYGLSKIKAVVLGGRSRQESLEKGLVAANLEPEDTVLVHNGANPLVSYREITEVISSVTSNEAAIVAQKITSTVKRSKDGDKVNETLNREQLFAAQTPQAARASMLKLALEKAKAQGQEFTDEAMMLENIGVAINLVRASEQNFKVTFVEDYHRVRHILGDRSDKFLVGIGQDSHRFSDKTGMTLAGVHFADLPAFDANSDGDVVLHAIFNAISQCLSEKSLGFYADPLCKKGIKDSKEYLKIMLEKLADKNLRINHLGLMIEGARPKIDPISMQLKQSLSGLLDLPAQSIGITATTGEDLTSFGRGEGLQCFAIISVEKVS